MSNAVVYQVLNCLPILCLLLSLIGDFFAFYFWNFILVGIFKIFFLVALVLIEFRQTPGLVKPFSFMFYFLGRGVFYLILGFTTMGITILSIVGNFIIVLVGLIYILLHFIHNGGEPEFMSFSRYQRLTSNISHTLPTTTQNTYPVAQQVPLSEQHTTTTTTNDVNGGQYNTSFPSDPTSPASVHVHSQDKTEV